MQTSPVSGAVSGTLAPNLFWLSIVICVLGTLAIGAIVYFGMYLYHRTSFAWDRALDRLDMTGDARNFRSRYLVEAYSDFSQRRNEFWTTYGQVILALLIIIVLTVLLLTRTISPEAGLPILSGISGFAIAKSISGARPSVSPDDRNG
jgi:TRAP-type C4-dicarboxylate transport system permease small subunit